MITGDYHHTAIAVARDVGMVKPGGQVVIIDTATQQQLRSESSVLRSQVASTRPKTGSTCHSLSVSPRIPGDTDQSQQQQQHSQQHAVPHQDTQQVSCSQSKNDDQTQLQTSQDVYMSQLASQSLGAVSLHTPFDQTQTPTTSFVGSEPSIVSAQARLSMHLSMDASTPKPNPMLAGLRLTIAGAGSQDASEVLSALAEGQMQCAVTGDAFEALLQHHDVSLLESILRSAVVFSRMKPHQKGQVMNLLGIGGIHQLINGQLRYILVCSSVSARLLHCMHLSVGFDFSC